MPKNPIICPYCQNSITDNGNRSYSCELNHSFDLSKEGYLNLLSVHQKKSKTPGDNEMMISARRSFLEKGFYDALIEDLKVILQEDLRYSNKSFVALDSGCGEGYYSEKVLQNIAGTGSQVLGTDISKYAIKNAAKKYKNNFYFVSSVYHLPIAPESIDILLSVFAPVDAVECQRVLSKNGVVLIVSPGSSHLKELAELIYDSFKPHETNVVKNMESSFKHLFTKKTTFNIHITSVETLMLLLKMTPYYWSTSEEKLEKFANCHDINITCDFNISVFRHIEI